MDKFYLSEPGNLELAISATGLAEDEIVGLVGKFKNNHHRWPGQLKGEVVVGLKAIQIRHHFTKKVLWEQAFDLREEYEKSIDF